MLGILFPFDNFIVGIVFVVVGIPVVASYCYAAYAHSNECELKRSMIERGMSAEEIERVIRAGQADSKDE